ncbi:diguanylate cyclase domain-containing protein [Bacillus taeanensis]|uniref:GGDEF domain-containing protein n=1 Tax=Bacillus taeanensis TaxID=273032 RepID=A0A366XVG4_9BACI|nr:GGDEF domain-containing protein [Bacillus taeanensis]RBW68749.1 hypothetical protein DS031_15460 [Bacillus taeanensis]
MDQRHGWSCGGDYVLKEFAKRVKKLIGKDHILARVGGDEFILLLPNIESEQCVIALADQIIKKMQKPIFVENNSFVATISAGITIFPTVTKEVHMIIRDADQALSYAKQNGRNHYQLFNEIQPEVPFLKNLIEF